MARLLEHSGFRSIGSGGGRLAQRDRQRRARRWRPGIVQALEGRALMAVSVVDPIFNQGQAIITPAGTTPAPYLDSQSVNAAVAVQRDGKIVVLDHGTNSADSFNPVVSRYNPNGTLDTTFGTGGQATLSIAKGAATDFTASSSLLIQRNGSVVVALNSYQAMYISSVNIVRDYPVSSEVVRLTATGALDSTFGTAGIATLTTDTPSFTQLLLQTDGKILLEGLVVPTPSPYAPMTQLAITRLNGDGTIDSSFNAGSLLLVPNPTAPDATLQGPTAVGAIGLTSTGQIKLVTEYPTGTDTHNVYAFVQINTDGTPDTTFGTGGTVTLADPAADHLQAAAILPDGRIALGLLGNLSRANVVVEVNSNGTYVTGAVALPFRIDTIAANADGSLAVGGGTALSENRYSNVQSLDVARLTAGGQLDTRFSPGGIVRLTIPFAITDSGFNESVVAANALAFTPSGAIVAAGSATYTRIGIGSQSRNGPLGSQSILAVFRSTNPLAGLNGDYDGDNKSDVAAQLANLGVFAYRKSTGGDVVQPFGAVGANQSIPAPGDYDGDGITDPALYLPNLGILAYRPSSGGPDAYVRFGPTGLGAAIPVPGDYDGDGKTDVAFYLPGSGSFIIRPSDGANPYEVSFGAAGAGVSLPAPGDYDGDGKTDLAVFLSNLGIFATRPSTGGGDTYFSFGPTGIGNAVPAPGDYDGDGFTDVALYLPGSSTFAIQPSNSILAYPVTFGSAGPGASIPVPGDYDGDGKTDIAVLLTGSATFAIDPSGSGTPYAQQFGAAGAGNTTPAAEPPGQALGSEVAVQALATSGSSGVIVYLPEDLPGSPTTRKKATT